MGALYNSDHDISIHALREEGDLHEPDGSSLSSRISIHALREEGDGTDPGASRGILYFNPRPPRGGRLFGMRTQKRSKKFQSTPSARRATVREIAFFSGDFDISIHALREEGDPGTALPSGMACTNFNPRPPRGGRLYRKDRTRASYEISIHALREEGDASFMSLCEAPTYFNPRPPRGGRHVNVKVVSSLPLFQSTPSARRATGDPLQPVHRQGISIHALREEGDILSCTDFFLGFQISIHALREEGDGRRPHCRGVLLYFNPRPPRGGRRSSKVAGE